jgi:hypothetical protein
MKTTWNIISSAMLTKRETPDTGCTGTSYAFFLVQAQSGHLTSDVTKRHDAVRHTGRFDFNQTKGHMVAGSRFSCPAPAEARIARAIVLASTGIRERSKPESPLRPPDRQRSFHGSLPFTIVGSLCYIHQRAKVCAVAKRYSGQPECCVQITNLRITAAGSLLRR